MRSAALNWRITTIPELALRLPVADIVVGDQYQAALAKRSSSPVRSPNWFRDWTVMIASEAEGPNKFNGWPAIRPKRQVSCERFVTSGGSKKPIVSGKRVTMISMIYEI